MYMEKLTAFLLVSVMVLSACEKKVDNTEGEVRQLSSYTVVYDGETVCEADLVNDEKGRVVKSETVYEGNSQKSETVTFEYGDSFCKVNKGDYCVIDFVMEGGKAVSSRYEFTYGDAVSEIWESSYRYDESGCLTGISQHFQGTSCSRSEIELVWENGCIQTCYEEQFGENDEVVYRRKEVFHYNGVPARMGNFNIFHKTYRNDVSYWELEYTYNLIGMQSRYLPVKKEVYCFEYKNGMKPGDPGDLFDEKVYELNMDYTLNEDGTVNAADIIETYIGSVEESSVKLSYSFRY